MSEFTILVVGLVDSNGGEMLYPDLYAAVPAELRQQLPQALKEAKKTGVLRQEVAFADGQLSHKILKVGGDS